jgi:hypothetical protein
VSQPVLLDPVALVDFEVEQAMWRSRQHADEWTNTGNDPQPSPPFVWACPECDRRFPSAPAVERHHEFEHGA